MTNDTGEWAEEDAEAVIELAHRAAVLALVKEAALEALLELGDHENSASLKRGWARRADASGIPPCWRRSVRRHRHEADGLDDLVALPTAWVLDHCETGVRIAREMEG